MALKPSETERSIVLRARRYLSPLKKTRLSPSRSLQLREACTCSRMPVHSTVEAADCPAAEQLLLTIGRSGVLSSRTIAEKKEIETLLSLLGPLSERQRNDLKRATDIVLRVHPVNATLPGRLRLWLGEVGLMPEIAGSKPDAALLDQRVQVVIDQSKAAIEASKETIEKSRELLERMKRAADRPLVPPPHSN